MTFIEISGRRIGEGYPPFVIAEIGINHEGEIEKAIQMVDDAISSNCECVKFQYHIISDEMIPNDVIPGNAEESIWEIMKRCSLSKKEEHNNNNNNLGLRCDLSASPLYATLNK